MYGLISRNGYGVVPGLKSEDSSVSDCGPIKLPLFGGFCFQAGDDEDSTDKPHRDKVKPDYPRKIEEIFDHVRKVIGDTLFHCGRLH